MTMLNIYDQSYITFSSWYLNLHPLHILIFKEKHEQHREDLVTDGFSPVVQLFFYYCDYTMFYHTIYYFCV